MKHRNTYNGCKLLIPTLDANAPVMNGKTADPACPNPAIHPIDSVNNQCGRILLDSFMTIGYIGPRRMPTTETATASPMSEGTNHTMSSRLW